MPRTNKKKWFKFQRPYIPHADNYQQDIPIQQLHATSRRIIDQQINNYISKQTSKHSNVILSPEHRQAESIKPQRLIPEEQLLKLIEDELAARGFPLGSIAFPSTAQPHYQAQSSPHNIVAEIANKAKEVLPAYRIHPGNSVPFHYQHYAKSEMKLNSIDKSIPTPKIEETKKISNSNIGRRIPQKSVQQSDIPTFLENYNSIPFAQLGGYSTTPQPSKVAFTPAIPKQFVSENLLLKSTVPQTVIGFNDNQNKQSSTPRNNPYFSSQQYINPYIESNHKKSIFTKKDDIVSINPLKNQDEHSARNHPLPPSQSSILVSHDTSINNDYMKSSNKNQYRLTNFGSKPLSSEEFQALVDAGYPVTAVPVPVPVPYDEYVKQQQRVTPLKSTLQTKISQRSKLLNFLEPVHIQQQKQQEHNGGTVVSQNF